MRWKSEFLQARVLKFWRCDEICDIPFDIVWLGVLKDLLVNFTNEEVLEMKKGEETGR